MRAGANKPVLRAPARPLPVGRYRLLYADPPWRYDHTEANSRAIENQYPTMTLEEICRLPIPAADDAVLFLWASSPKLADAIRVMDACSPFSPTSPRKTPVGQPLETWDAWSTWR